MRLFRVLQLSLASLLCVLSVDAAAASGGQGATYVAGEVIVRFKSDIGADSRRAVRQAEGAEFKQSARLTESAQLLRLEPGVAVGSAVAAFEQRPEVLYAQPNFIREALAKPNDPFFQQLWGLHNVGQVVNGDRPGTRDADIDAPKAWKLTTGSSAVTAAIIDSGIQYDHPDLAANISDLPGVDFAAGDFDPRDEFGHGTHVAGIVAARGNNGIGVVGASWVTELLPVRVLDAEGFGTEINVANGITYAGQTGVQVANLSLGTSFESPLMREALSSASDVLFVAAAGNSGQDNDIAPEFPCNYSLLPNVICVAATTQNDVLADFSNFGARSVNIAAPGGDERPVPLGNILSTVPTDAYGYFEGTSQATPLVTGVAALIKARFPSATPADIENRILSSVDRLPALSGRVSSNGRLNAFRALRTKGDRDREADEQ
jgi:subtilisin family serine protease